MSDESLRGRVVRGVGWTAGSRLAGVAGQFAVSIGLARLLDPRDFGLVGMVMVFNGFVSLFGDLGLGAALVQRKEIGPEQGFFVFWVNLAEGEC